MTWKKWAGPLCYLKMHSIVRKFGTRHVGVRLTLVENEDTSGFVGGIFTPGVSTDVRTPERGCIYSSQPCEGVPSHFVCVTFIALRQSIGAPALKSVFGDFATAYRGKRMVAS